MEGPDSIAVRRPKHWDKPMDPSMTDADIAWLKSREPFVSLSSAAFPRTMPLEGILRNDCQLHRCEPGQLIVREGDYGNSAFLLLAGSVNVMVDSLSVQQLGRAATRKRSWIQAVKQLYRRSAVPETRRAEQVTPIDEDGSSMVREVDRRPAIFLQDFDVVLCEQESVALGPGELFGEVAAMYRSPRTASVVAGTEATLLEIRWQGLKILRRDADFARKQEEHYRANWLAIHLREIPLLRHLPETSLQRVVAATQLHSFGRMQWNTDYQKTRRLAPSEQIASEPVVADEGREPTELVVVRSGFGRLCQQYGAAHRTTAYLGKSHLFGLEEVAYNAVRPADTPPRTLKHSLRAVGFLDTLHIPVECFAAEILPHIRRNELPASVAEHLLQTDRRNTGDRRREPRQSAPRPRGEHDTASQTGTSFEQTDLLEFIVQNRFNNGRQAMVIDLHRCTRCDDCVKACASVHDGNPRFVRQGVSQGRLQFTQACMQCTDPVCMIGCPTGALARNEVSGVVEIHEPICVGCGICASACPYENIRMAEVFDAGGLAFTDADSGKPITKATKCDMCSSSPSGPACAAACPHDALVRIDLSESKPLSDWLERRG